VRELASTSAATIFPRELLILAAAIAGIAFVAVLMFIHGGRFMPAFGGPTHKATVVKMTEIWT
jgi:hypothetical protein